MTIIPATKSENVYGPKLDMNKFHVWMINAAPGDSVIYFRGELATYLVARADDTEALRIAEMASNGERGGKLCLTQKRIAAFDYEYIATKRHRSEPIDKRLYAGLKA